jgi:hypothetical protein
LVEFTFFGERSFVQMLRCSTNRVWIATMMHQLRQDEADVAADEEEMLMVQDALLHLRARINAPP